MRILLSNDDGINAPGLKILESIALTLTDDVWVVAPEQDQSAVGHGLTLRSPFRIREVDSKKYAVAGTPTDCVFAATHYILQDHKPDLVLSGVNFGGNIGEDITYSGTVAAAMEATILGFPAVAMSLSVEILGTPNWSVAEHWGPKVLKKLLAAPFPENVFYNVNFPNMDYNKIEGMRATHQGQISKEDSIHPCKDPIGNPYYWIAPGEHRYKDVWLNATKGSDLEAMGKKWVSITPLSINLTHYATLDTLKSMLA